MSNPDWPLKSVTYREGLVQAIQEVANLLKVSRCTEDIEEALNHLEFLAKDFKKRLHAKESVEERIARTREFLEQTKEKLTRPTGTKP